MRFLLRVQPKAKKEGFELLEDGRLKLKIRAQPQDGKANARVIEIVSKCLGFRKSSISIVQGETSRDKMIEVDGLEVEDINSLLLSWKPN